MLVNICSSTSSGSTLLSNVLDRHPAVACGDELKLFSQALLYDDYERFRRFRRWFRVFGLSGRPYHDFRVIVDHLGDYGLPAGEFWGWVAGAKDFRGLATRFHDHVVRFTGRPIWAEKTPRNIRVIGKFLAAFPEAKVVHIVRDPRDAVLSMLSKVGNPDPVRPTAGWLASVSAIQPYRDRPNVHEIRYEDLCSQPEVALSKLCAFLGIDFDRKHFAPENAEVSALGKGGRRRGWQNAPSEGFSTRSIGKWRKSPIDWSFAGRMRLTAEFAALLGTRQWTAAELAGQYGYELPSAAGASAAYAPLNRARSKNFWVGWLDRWAALPAYVDQVECAASGESPTR
jgi:hypothetical protein